MRIIICVLLFILMQVSVCSQHLLKGSILDEAQVPLVGATVVLLEPVDSSMVTFAISDSDGIFTIEVSEMGTYILQISFVSYSMLNANVEAKGDKKINLGSFSLEPSSEILKEVTVKAEHIPMGVIGDTISYNAAAFQTKPGATVEDLLKKLPGVEVQRDGSIKAMGEEVGSVLVDGKEFFGDDPKIATKNLEAEAVDKVQVFDKKSEIAEFTGIDDGEEEKTINLKLKEEYKKGGFGTAHLAGGTESVYDAKLNYNRFSPKMQAAVILSGNNINKQAFSFNEYISFMGGLGNAISNTNAGLNFGEFSGGATPQGITDNISSGLNFNYDLSTKLKLTSHYFYVDVDQDLERTTRGSQFSDDITFETLDNSTSNKRNRNHRLQAKLSYKPNLFTQVKWNNTLSSISNNNTSLGNTEFQFMGMPTSFTTSDVSTDGLQRGLEGSLIVRKRFAKKGRNWINSAKYNYGTSNEESNLQNQVGDISELSDIIQNQLYDYRRNGVTYESAYTEPLSRRIYLSGSYIYDYDQESPDKLFFDLFGGEGELNRDLSRSFVKTNIIHRGTLSVRRNTKRLKLNGGLSFQSSSIQGEVKDDSFNLIEDLDNSTTNFLPSVSLDYDVTKDASIKVNYRTSVRLPTLQQLAPLPDNDNPNLLILGNPDLIPTYTHNIGIGYRSIDMFNYKNFFANFNLSIAQNQVINSVSIDPNLIRTLRPINSDGFINLQGYVSYSAPIRLLKLKFHASSQFRWSGYDSFINNQISNVNETNATISLTLDNRKKEVVDIASGLDLSLTDRKYDINDNFNQSFFNYSLFVDGIFYIGNTWAISSKYDYRSFSGEFFSDARAFHLWSAKLQKTFGNNKYSVILEANDILDQTRGVERSGGLSALYDTQFNTRSRYVTLGFSVKLGRKKGAAVEL